jgi:small-conductance mechanosensitive channel
MNELLRSLRETALLLDRIGFDIGSHRISLWSGIFLILVVIAVIAGARLGGKLVRRLFSRIDSLDPAQQLLGEKIASIAIWTMAILVGIDVLGISLTALTVFTGAFGLAIGFGLQKTVGNLFAGIILLADRSIKPGDVIAVNDGTANTMGQVKKIGLRAVSVTTRDQREYLIPNENLMVNQVENWSYSSKNVRIQVPVCVAYSTDLDLAERLMLEAARSVDRILTVPAPAVWLGALGQNGIDFVIQCWIDDPEEGIGNVRSSVLRALWTLFQEHGIQVPYPQQDVHVRSLPKSD